VDVYSYNSKVVLHHQQGAGSGDQITRFPVTGTKRCWMQSPSSVVCRDCPPNASGLPRPTPYADQVQVLPVDWVAITAQGSTVTNYQVMPGDRIFIAEDELVAVDTRIGKIVAPIERVMGFSLLGVGDLEPVQGERTRQRW